MLDQPEMKQKPTALAELPSRLHHHAFVVKDQEVNRHFFEDILGMPLVATWCQTTAIQTRPAVTCRPWVATRAKKPDRNPLRCGP